MKNTKRIWARSVTVATVNFLIGRYEITGQYEKAEAIRGCFSLDVDEEEIAKVKEDFAKYFPDMVKGA